MRFNLLLTNQYDNEMKKLLLFFSMVLATMALSAQVETEIVTGAGYPDEVYYSLEDGIVSTLARDTWDLGFTTSNFSISILANTASEVEVYTYPDGDTADWANLDTTGMVWTPLYNSIETLDEGAFSYNSTGHPDYGWGTYNMTTHNITGDSLYVIKTVGGVFKKLAILKRMSMANTWTFKFANLDGTEEQTVELNSGDYTDKAFVYYSIDNMEILDREPAKTSWDLLFSRYYDYTIPYMVSGVLTNELHVMAQEVKEEGLDQGTFVEFEDSSFTSVISVIGSDWKSFNMGEMMYELDSTVVFFLKKYAETESNGMKAAGTDSTYYKIYFTGFDMSTGLYTFIQEKLSAVSTGNPGMIQIFQVYPNPASEYVNVVFDYTGDTEIQIIDMTGRTVHSIVHHAGGFTNLSLDIARLKPGLFFLKVNNGNETGVVRFIKE